VRKARQPNVSMVIERMDEILAREAPNSSAKGFRKSPKEPRAP